MWSARQWPLESLHWRTLTRTSTSWQFVSIIACSWIITRKANRWRSIWTSVLRSASSWMVWRRTSIPPGTRPTRSPRSPCRWQCQCWRLQWLPVLLVIVQSRSSPYLMSTNNIRCSSRNTLQCTITPQGRRFSESKTFIWSPQSRPCALITVCSPAEDNWQPLCSMPATRMSKPMSLRAWLVQLPVWSVMAGRTLTTMPSSTTWRRRPNSTYFWS